jgi:hypothetical protein
MCPSFYWLGAERAVVSHIRLWHITVIDSISHAVRDKPWQGAHHQRETDKGVLRSYEAHLTIGDSRPWSNDQRFSIIVLQYLSIFTV